MEQPDIIILNVRVRDYDAAHKWMGVEPTYKKKRGFAPLKMTWGPFIIDAILRSGKNNPTMATTRQRRFGALLGFPCKKSEK